MIEGDNYYTEKVRQFYDRNPQKEWDRLFVDKSHKVEFDVTNYYLDKYLPRPGSRLLDVGSGPGRYAIPLAAGGYLTTLVDISQNELDLAQEKAREFKVEHNIEAAIQANIIDLSLIDDNSYDAVLAIGGVMSHLMTVDQRQQAIKELSRVAKPNSPIFISVMSRYGEIGNRLIRNPQDVQYIDQFLQDGRHINPENGVFTYAYFYTPDELKDLILGDQLTVEQLISVQSISTPLREQVNNLSDDLYDEWMKVFVSMSQEPSLLGISSHIMAIARNK